MEVGHCPPNKFVARMERSAIREAAVVERPAAACNLWVADPRESNLACAPRTIQKQIVGDSASQNVVIPAKAGIQVLNVSRALRAISKSNCGWLRPCALGDFSLSGQRKVTKRKAARMARFPALRAFGPQACATRRPCRVRKARTPRSAPPPGLPATGWRCSGAPYGDSKTAPQPNIFLSRR